MSVLGCEQGSYTVEVTFKTTPEVRNQVNEVQVRVLRNCVTVEPVNDNVVVITMDGAVNPKLGNLEPGSYGIEAVGYRRQGSQLCAIVRGCSPQPLEAGGDKVILVEMEALSSPSCTTETDAGVDSGVDAGFDAGGDGSVEPDAYMCTPDTEVCNEMDDDCDRNFDETTNKMIDRANCGSCDNLCDSNLTCANGRCSPPAIQLALGEEHACALREDGDVFCWGENLTGQLGTEDFEEALVAGPVVELEDVVEIGTGAYFSCALRDDQKVLCWGENVWGQLGMAFEPSRTTPVIISRLDPAVALGTGYRHGCVVTDEADVSCWGWNGYGQLGRSFISTANFERIPAVIPNLHNVADVDGGFKSSCARHTNGTVSCWGNNDKGQLGDGTTTSRITPALVTVASGDPIDNVIALAVGGETACVIREGGTSGEGTVLCWGDNSEGAVGNGNSTNPILRATATNLTDAVEVSAGTQYACARRSNGAAMCWGTNVFGQVGDGTGSTRRNPTAVAGLSNATALFRDGGVTHGCAIREDLVVMCWGANQSGQLGNGTKSDTPSLSPVRVLGI